jgi:hypothetical protein
MNNATQNTTATAYNAGTAHKVLGAVAALAATLLLQGTLLTGFDNLAAREAVNAAATTQMATLPAVTVVHKRG